MRDESGHYVILIVRSDEVLFLSWDNKEELPLTIDGKPLIDYAENKDGRIIAVQFGTMGISPLVYEITVSRHAHWKLANNP